MALSVSGALPGLPLICPRKTTTMTTPDREITQAVEPDGGLEDYFIEAAVRVLGDTGIAARYDFPGCLFFDALGREWATAYTGLHVNDNEGYGDEFPGDERLVALESRGTLSVGEYADTLLAVIADDPGRATSAGHRGLLGQRAF